LTNRIDRTHGRRDLGGGWRAAATGKLIGLAASAAAFAAMRARARRAAANSMHSAA
jgi:hypothetical protein